MSLVSKPSVIALVQFSSAGFFQAAKLNAEQSEFEFREVSSESHRCWTDILGVGAEAALLVFAGHDGEVEDCIGRILKNTAVSLMIYTLSGYSGAPGDRVEAHRINPGLQSPPAQSVVSDLKALLARRRSDQPKISQTLFPLPRPSFQTVNSMIIAVGASTGGTEALAKFFRILPEPMPGIVVVQHMPPVFTNMYAERLNGELPFTVTEAKDGVQIKPNTIHIAPGDRHLTVKKRGLSFFTCVKGTEKVSGHCPSVDVLFRSAAKEAASQAVGIIFTGMGADGAEGLLEMRSRGAFTIGQDEASCVVYGMPRKAYEIGAVTKQAALADIPRVLLTYLCK